MDNLNKKNSYMPMLICFAIFLAVLYCKYAKPTESPKVEKTPVTTINTAKTSEILINDAVELNYLSKEQIYQMREKSVVSSLFYSRDYKPNEEIFGQIEGGKPWWSFIRCHKLDYTGDNHENIEGKSKVSTLLNNPDLLIGVIPIFIPYDRPTSMDYCNAQYSKWIPASLEYDNENNLLIAKYKVSRQFPYVKVRVSGKEKQFPLQLAGLNAKDLGFNYAFADKLENISMSEDDNISKDIKTFADFIHLGSSCNYKDGCNNISPMQPDKQIYVKDLPAQIDLKLWKDQPKNKKSQADIYYRIIFEEDI